MIKTIKVKKKLRLDELIKYIFDNGIEDKTYGVTDAFNNTSEVRISGAGNIKMSGYINEHTIFTIEVEEEITEDTKFKSALVVHYGEELELYENLSIKGFKFRWPNSLQMHAIVNGKLELIWESGSDE